MVDMLKDLTWTDLDLTAFTSGNAKFAILSLRLKPDILGTGDVCYFGVRRNGDTPTYFPRFELHLPGTTESQAQYRVVIVGMDGDQVIEYRISVGTGWELWSRITVLGYIE